MHQEITKDDTGSQSGLETELALVLQNLKGNMQ